MNREETKRQLRKASLVLTKGLAAQSDSDRIVADGHTANDLLRIVRNRIWDKYGPEELQALETEIDLDLPNDPRD